MLEQPMFGQRVRALRLQRGLSQVDLAGDAMSTAYLSRLESGARPPTTKSVKHLAARLGVTVAELEDAGCDPQSELVARAVSAGTAAETAELIGGIGSADAVKDLALRWIALWTRAGVSGELGRLQEQIEALEALEPLSRRIGSPQLEVRALTTLARCRRRAGDISGAGVAAGAAYATATEHGLGIQDTVRALLALISVETEAGNLTSARRHTEDLDHLASDAPGTLSVEALWTSANVHVRQGDHDAARALLERALQHLDSRQDVHLWMRLRLAAASLYLQMTPRHAELAADCLADAERALQLLGAEQQHQEFLLLKGKLAVHRRSIDEARELCRLLDGSVSHLHFREQIRLDVLRCQIRILTGDRDGGIAEMEDLAKRAQDAANLDLATEIWRALAEALAHP